MISVIIPAHNAASTIDRSLDALTHQTVPPDAYEILVVDDGSSDDTRTAVLRHETVRMLTQEHAGPAAARNLGAQHARGEILLFTDADCAPAPDWIEVMAGPLRDLQPAPAAGPIVGVKGAYLTQQRALVARFVQAEYEDKYDRLARQGDIDFVDTYSAGYRRDIFLASGGFDTSFPVASVEDQEFSFRLSRQGYRMVFLPQARVYHLGHPENLITYWRRKFKIGYWKVNVVRRHPGKLWRDSHTPQSLKVQILLAGLAGACLLGGAFWTPALWGSALAVSLFLLTTARFGVKAWRKDRAVALVSPFLLLVRAVALGTGLLAGVVGSVRRLPLRRDS